jgi:predicted TIM-barrel fold metal-dependent hydrolase
MKISGIGVPGEPWSVDLQQPVVEALIESFGPSRAMFASNFPVDGLTGSFEEIFTVYKALTRGLPEADRRALFHDTACRVYRIGHTANV